ncbi:hypothetical protein M404DRAFT_1000760, partial [Pisolithus tinctorius Marx 270]
MILPHTNNQVIDHTLPVDPPTSFPAIRVSMRSRIPQRPSSQTRGACTTVRHF